MKILRKCKKNFKETLEILVNYVNKVLSSYVMKQFESIQYYNGHL